MAEYRNPQSEPGGDKRMLIALLGVFVVLGLLQFILPKPPQPPPQQQQQAQQTPQQAPAQPSNTPAAATSPTPAGKAAAGKSGARPAGKQPAASKLPVNMADKEAETVLDNGIYRITFTNRGAVVKSWVLNEKSKDGSYKYTDNSGKPFDLVNPTVAQQLGYPFSLLTYDQSLKGINDGLYVVSSPIDIAGALVFKYSDGDVQVVKSFRAEKDHILNVEIEVTRDGQRVPAFPQWPSGLGDQLAPASFVSSKLDWAQNGNIERQDPVSGGFLRSKKWIVGGQSLPGPYNWVATADRYFAVAFMPLDPKDSTLVTLNSPADVPKNPERPNEGTDKANVIGMAVGSPAGLTKLRVFAGPKAVDLLEDTQAQPGGPDLRGVYDFGTFSFIARPLFLWLKWTYEKWIPNWGWAISFLTLVITMALLPLRISSMKSSLRMQRIQPQIKAITEKYKRYSITDPRRAEMQKEMSALYKKEGVNPIGGCFPLLLQMPFLIAFYSMLNNAIELRHATWLWIHDLSVPDPIHVLPILIMVSMYVQQKSAPQGGMDPAQQKILTFMGPLMIGGLSWGVASGLSIYWALSTLLGYAQQLVINRSELGQQVKKTMERRASRKR
ncbi:MAG TPA: membrane protein insertase YidC [Candidatus Angelobacter sp.]|nr:membrane protein insertase YidC [Candidatus Angelobacter sp.]